MPALPTSRRPRARTRLVALLDRAAADLTELEFYADGLRSQLGAHAEFSSKELESLISTVSEGRRAILNRLHELRPERDPLAGEVATSRTEPLPLVPMPASLIITYKRCSRRVGLAWQEAREAMDHASGESLYRLLRAMEKQLWLISPGRQPRPHFSPVSLFQTC